MLKVLFTEKSYIRADRAQQLGHDGGNAVKVARASLSLPAFAQPLDRNGRCETRRIDLISLRQPKKVAACFGKHLRVPLLLARVASEVLVGAELQRVHENGRGNDLRPSLGLFDESKMARVKRPHGRH